VRAWVMRDFTPTHSDFRVRIQISYSPQSLERVSSGTVRRLLKASSRHPALRERARLLTSCPPLHPVHCLHRPPSLPTSKTRILLCDDTIAPPNPCGFGEPVFPAVAVPHPPSASHSVIPPHRTDRCGWDQGSSPRRPPRRALASSAA
jgi:hypothetical protein